ncbi:hypothetical protein IJ425_03145 [bacterium]|nr:hypothetical protein [bacterium]
MPKQEDGKKYPKEAFIKIKYTKGVSAKEFSEYIKSLDKEYTFFLKKNKLEALVQPELEITKIEQGSLDIFLAAVFCPGILPLLSNANIIFDFLSHIKNGFHLLLEGRASELSSPQLNNYAGMNNLTINGNASITYIDNRNGVLENMGPEIDFNLSNTAKNILEEEKQRRIPALPQDTFNAVPFSWESAKFKDNKKFNFKGICEKISKKPLNVIFSSDEMKKYMTEDSHLGKPWQDLIYVVDVELETNQGQQILKILKVYEDQTFFADR